MTEAQATLWHKIETFALDDPEAAFSFTDRLARENRWSLSYSLGAVAEYKRFIFLICVSGRSLTPSDQVDQVWHLHLLYTESYWIDLCQNTLQRQIHHGPTRGGQREKQRFNNAYEDTLAQYRLFFNEEPPADFWPDSATRFSDIHFQRVNIRKHWVIRRPFNFDSR